MDVVPPLLLDLLTLAVLALVGTRLAGAAWAAVAGPGRRRVRAIVAGLRLRHFLSALPVLAAVAGAAAVLVRVPGLDLGWWTAIGGVGNPVIGGSQRTAGTPLSWLVPAVFLALLLPGLPLFAEAEERTFRLGSEHRSVPARAGRGVMFGLAHALIGIPVGVALALSLGGWYFTWAYLRGWRRGGPLGGLLESTRAHLAYNLVIVAVLVVALLGGAAAG